MRTAPRLRRAVVASAGLVLVAGLVSTGASTSSADPAEDVASARERVEQSHHRAEQALERYLAVTDRLKDNRAEAAAVQRDVERQQRAYDAVRDDLGATIANQLTDAPMGPTAQLLGSEDPDDFLDGLSAMQAYSTNQSDRLTAFTRQARQLEVRRAQLATATREIERDRAALRQEKDALDRRAEQAEATLASLTAQQRAAVDADGGDDSVGAVELGSVDASGAAKKAIEFALSQLGDPYRYGGTGPDSWDCSGLTGGAWRAAGVSLPRSSGAQAGAGSPVSRSEMSPGDLVFYYSPVSHVGIYLGDGRLVHAPRTGRNVEVVPVDSMPVSSVRRVG